jgi:hypothetical protein
MLGSGELTGNYSRLPIILGGFLESRVYAKLLTGLILGMLSDF